MSPAMRVFRTPTSRFLHGTLGAAVGAAMLGAALVQPTSPAAAEPLRPDAGSEPSVGRHVPATEAGIEAQCGVPADADDDVLVTVKRVADERQVSAKVRLAMYETAWVESHANNLDCGDSDSLGVFQQRPSMGWGTKEQILDVDYAANKFLDGNDMAGAIRNAELNPTWSAGQVSQETQRSAFPDRYDESQAKAVDLMDRAAELDTDPLPVGDYAWPTVRDGDSGTKVRALQLLLNEHGASLEADGDFGAKTTAAVKEFQTDNKLESDGVVGEKTWSELVVNAEEGATGAVVSAIQWELNSEGYAIEVDGEFGPKTAAAVASMRDYYQIDAGESVDATAWRALLH